MRILRTSVGVDLERLVVGEDAVFDPAQEHGLALSKGLVLSDGLSIEERTAIDDRAARECTAWRLRRTSDLTICGLDLAWIFEAELLASCFLPAARLAFAADGHSEVELVGFGSPMARLLREAGITVVEAGTRPPMVEVLPTYRKLDRLRSAGPRAHGDILAASYWNLTPVYGAIARRRPAVLVAMGLSVPGLPRPLRALMALAGGWVGSPSRGEVVRAAADIAQALAGLTAYDAWDAIALDYIARSSAEVVARACRIRSAFGQGNLRAVVTPFDSPPLTRAMVAVAREYGGRSLVVQHGFDGRLNDPDKRVADHVAVWTTRDRDDLAPHAAGLVEVTGNPGAEHLSRKTTRAAAGPVVLLVDYPGRLTSALDARLPMQHVEVGLAGISKAHPRADVVVRPHPSDPLRSPYLALAARHPGLSVTVDTRTPVEHLMSRTGTCVGALSTATLQALALGVPTVHLDVGGIARPWPFDGTVPMARTAEELAAVLAELPEGRQSESSAALEALGARPGATARVVGMIDSLRH